MTTSTRSVDRALDLLAGVTDGEGATSLSELARGADLSASTASRLLATLASRGFVRRDDAGAYRPGSRLLQVGASALRGERVYELAGPHLERLASETGETASLGIPIDGDQVLYLRQAASPRLVQTAAWTGRTIPREGTAIGAALAGEVGDHGYVSTRSTVEPDVTAVAAPVIDGASQTVAALNVIAPTYRTSDRDVEAIGLALAASAARLSRELGAPTEVPA